MKKIFISTRFTVFLSTALFISYILFLFINFYLKNSSNFEKSRTVLGTNSFYNQKVKIYSFLDSDFHYDFEKEITLPVILDFTYGFNLVEINENKIFLEKANVDIDSTSFTTQSDFIVSTKDAALFNTGKEKLLVNKDSVAFYQDSVISVLQGEITLADGTRIKNSSYNLKNGTFQEKNLYLNSNKSFFNLVEKMYFTNNINQSLVEFKPSL